MQCRAREERPGRKTDLLDAEWLVHLLECGLLRGWLIPPADIKAARDVIRYRRKLVEHRTSKLQRLGNVLQDAGIKADSVASSVTPKSVRAMVEALIDGERRPAVLADLARGSMRSKIPDLQRALEGRFDDHHALMCRLHLAHLDQMPASGPTPTPQYYQGGGWGAPPSGGPSPWAQTPRKTNPWPLVAGAAAVVLVLVLGAIGIWIAIRPKPVQPPQPVAEERLSALLLNSSEVNAVMGSSSMQPGKPITSMDSSPVTVSLPDCQGALYTSQDPVYAGTGYTAINGLISSEPGDNYEHWVNQAVVAFPTADKARAFVQTSADKCKNCAGKTVTVTNKAKTYRWTFADVKGSPPTITVIDTQEGAEGWECNAR